jgi:hypothetical protein
MTEQFMENISNKEHERLLLLCGHGIGAPLSPAAQAVLNAYRLAPIEDELTAAAVLRAAADQVVPPERERLFIEKRAWDFELCVEVDIRSQLLAIAAELEGVNG